MFNYHVYFTKSLNFSQVSGIPEGNYIDTRQNNGGLECNPPNQIFLNPQSTTSTQRPAVSTQMPLSSSTTQITGAALGEAVKKINSNLQS